MTDSMDDRPVASVPPPMREHERRALEEAGLLEMIEPLVRRIERYNYIAVSNFVEADMFDEPDPGTRDFDDLLRDLCIRKRRCLSIAVPPGLSLVRG